MLCVPNFHRTLLKILFESFFSISSKGTFGFVSRSYSPSPLFYKLIFIVLALLTFIARSNVTCSDARVKNLRESTIILKISVPRWEAGSTRIRSETVTYCMTHYLPLLLNSHSLLHNACSDIVTGLIIIKVCVRGVAGYWMALYHPQKSCNNVWTHLSEPQER
jgi:hypothetical protein